MMIFYLLTQKTVQFLIVALCAIHLQAVKSSHLQSANSNRQSSVIYEHQQGILGSGSSSSSFLHHGPAKQSNKYYFPHTPTVEKPGIYGSATASTAYVTSSFTQTTPKKVSYDIVRAPILYYENVSSKNLNQALTNAFSTVVDSEIKSDVGTTYANRIPQLYPQQKVEPQVYIKSNLATQPQFVQQSHQFLRQFGQNGQYVPPRPQQTQQGSSYQDPYSSSRDDDSYLQEPSAQYLPPPQQEFASQYQQPSNKYLPPKQIPQYFQQQYIPQQQYLQQQALEQLPQNFEQTPQQFTSQILSPPQQLISPNFNQAQPSAPQISNSNQPQQLISPNFNQFQQSTPQILNPPSPNFNLAEQSSTPFQNNVPSQFFNQNFNAPQQPTIQFPQHLEAAPQSQNFGQFENNNNQGTSEQLPHPRAPRVNTNFDNSPLLSPDLKLAPPTSPDQQPRVITAIRNEAIRSQILSNSGSNGGRRENNLANNFNPNLTPIEQQQFDIPNFSADQRQPFSFAANSIDNNSNDVGFFAAGR